MVKAKYRSIPRPGKRGCIRKHDIMDRYIGRINYNGKLYSCIVSSYDVAEFFIECILHNRIEEVHDILREF